MSGSASHSIDLSGLENTDSYITSASLVGTDLTFTSSGSAFNSTVDLSGLESYITSASLVGTDLTFTSSGSAFNSTVDLSSLSTLPSAPLNSFQFNSGSALGGSELYYLEVNNSVGLNTTTPEATFHVRAANNASASLLIETDSLGQQESGSARLDFRVADNENGYKKYAIIARNNGDGFGRGSLHFALDNTANFSNAQLDDSHLIIQSDGKVLMPNINNSVQNTVIGYDIESGELTYYSTASFGSGGGVATPVDTGSFYLSSSVAGNVITFTQGDGTTESLTVDTGSGGGGGSTSPGGSDGQVQYNNGGAFGGESTFTYDDGNNTLTIQGATNQPSIVLSNAQSVSLSNGSQLSEIQTFYSTNEVGTIAFVAEGAFNPGDTPTRLELRTTNDGASSPTTKLTIFNDGKTRLNQYGSGTFTGQATKWLAVDSSGNIIEEDVPAGSFTRPVSATSIAYDTYLSSTQYTVDQVGTSPAAPNANGDVSIRYAVSNIGSNVDRIDVYKTDGGGSSQSTTLENLAISGSIVLVQVGGGSHTERYRINSTPTDNSTYMSYPVVWESGDDAAFTTGLTMNSTFDSDYEYELATGYNRLLITNNSNSASQRFRMVKPASAAAGDEVIVELKVNTSGQNVKPVYQVRNGTSLFVKMRTVTEIEGTTVSEVNLDTNDVAIMRFQVNDLGSTEGLTLLGANQMIYA